MPRFRLSFVKHILLALFALVGLVCTLEVGLSVAQICRPACESRNGPCPLGFQHSQLLEASWTSHHRLKPLQNTVSSVPGGGNLTLRTNRFGLRGDDVRTPKPADVFRVLCLGDETVLAAEVEEIETFSVRLQEILQKELNQKVEVLNGGVPGDCPLLAGLRFQHELLSLEPDLVVMHFDMSDVSDDHGLRPFTIHHDDTDTACPHPNLSNPKKSPLKDWERFRTVQWVRETMVDLTEDEAPRDDTEDIDSRQGRFAWLRDKPPDWSVYIDQSLQPLLKLRDLLQRRGGKLLVSTSPAPWQVSKLCSAGRGVREAAGVPPNAHYKSRRPFEVLSAWCAAHELPFVDASPAITFQEKPERLYLKHAPRFSTLGHELYAREIAAGVLRSFFQSGSPVPWTEESAGPRQQALGRETLRN